MNDVVLVRAPRLAPEFAALFRFLLDALLVAVALAVGHGVRVARDEERGSRSCPSMYAFILPPARSGAGVAVSVVVVEGVYS